MVSVKYAKAHLRFRLRENVLPQMGSTRIWLQLLVSTVCLPKTTGATLARKHSPTVLSATPGTVSNAKMDMF